jgi:hypothetical protein
MGIETEAPPKPCPHDLNPEEPPCIPEGETESEYQDEIVDEALDHMSP